MILKYLLRPTVSAPDSVRKRLNSLLHLKEEFPAIPWSSLRLWCDSATLMLARSHVPRKTPPQPSRRWWLRLAKKKHGVLRLVTALIGHTGCRGTSAYRLRWEDVTMAEWGGETALQVDWRATKTNRRGRRVERTWIRDPATRMMMESVLRNRQGSTGLVMDAGQWRRWVRMVKGGP